MEFFVSTRAIAGTRKNISGDDPRIAYRAVFLLRAFLLSHSVSAALNEANLFSAISFPVL
jgi:hypothetical protein